MPKIAALTTSLLILAAAASGCGGSSNSSSASATAAASTPTASAPAGAGASTLSDAADPSGQLKFTQTSLTAKAGKVTIKFTNDSPATHNFTIQQGTSGVVGATPTFVGGSKTLTVNLRPGTYTFFCSVPGHRDAGMQGTLTVR